MSLTINSLSIHGKNTADIDSSVVLISSIEEGLNLLGDMYYQGFDQIILREHNFTSEFFDLKTGIAGEILQKFSNYRMSLIIVGDFSKYESESLKAFIIESNSGNTVNFVCSIDELIKQ